MDFAETETVRTASAILAQRFPLCFLPTGTPRRRIKDGIISDLMGRCPDVPRDLLWKALIVYCQHPEYREALLYGAPCVDLDGKEWPSTRGHLRLVVNNNPAAVCATAGLR